MNVDDVEDVDDDGDVDDDDDEVSMFISLV